ncbi:uncharacterized protein LOC132904314 [Amyelois transitella]|uniref:uncharacterized protein LOC132904314 n=1 Tax=Amyelois transitella TaxID=680683 RepID=UPI0029902ECE|nr:uncharacterized protein LOC132904314 [Amyelois transitella]
MEKTFKKQIVKSAAAVKRKVGMINDTKNVNNMALEKIFKPIVDPLNLIANKNNEKWVENENNYIPSVGKKCKNESTSSYSSNEESNDTVSESDFPNNYNKTLISTPSEDHNVSEGSFKSIASSPDNRQTLSWSTSSEVMDAIPFGVRHERGKLMLGNIRVFDNDNILKIGTRILKKTDGLRELLFKRKPDLEKVREEDLQNYKLLLIDTNAHRRNYESSKPINSNKGFKYINVIKPLFKFSKNLTSSVESLPQGKGIPLLKKVKKYTDYVYWDDPNELVERLKLLLGSRAAGNSGVDNEIIAVIEELREAGIINIEHKQLSPQKMTSIIRDL